MRTRENRTSRLSTRPETDSWIMSPPPYAIPRVIPIVVSIQAEAPIPSSFKNGVSSRAIMAVIPILSRILNTRSKPNIIKNIIIYPRA
jgi:hypothetical protein